MTVGTYISLYDKVTKEKCPDKTRLPPGFGKFSKITNAILYILVRDDELILS